jgi:hypothetical protein
MAMCSVADFGVFLNQQIGVQRKMEECLWDVEALLAVALTTANFYELPRSTLHCYFSVVADLIKEVLGTNRSNLNYLLHQEK